MNNRPTVFIVSPFFQPNTGGVESHLKKLTEYLIGHGHRVIVSTYQPLMTEARGLSFEESEDKPGLTIYRQTWFGRGWFGKLESYFPLVFLYLFPGLFYQSLKVYRKHREEIEVIHAHGFIAALIALFLKRLDNKRIVVSTHAIYHFKGRPILAFFMKRILKPFDYILAVGQPSKAEVILDLSIPSEKVEVHPNWIDLSTFKSPGRQLAKERLGLSGKFVVLFIGRLIEKKGVRVLLEVAKKLPAATFVFIGDGEMEPAVEAAAKGGNLNVKKVGRLSQGQPEELKELINYYSAADVMASPVQYDEGFATVYLEALACETPILTAKKGQLPHFLTDEVGVLLEEATVPAVYQTLSDWLKNREKLERLAEAARAYAVRHFSEDNVKVITNAYLPKTEKWPASPEVSPTGS